MHAALPPIRSDAALSAPRRRPTTSPRRVTAGRGPVATRATYWRRRLATAVLVVVLVLLTAQAGAALSGGGSPPAPVASGHRSDVVQVVVRPGDSLWSIAERVAPGADPHPVVDALAAARGNAPLQPGETIEWGG